MEPPPATIKQLLISAFFSSIPSFLIVPTPNSMRVGLQKLKASISFSLSHFFIALPSLTLKNKITQIGIKTSEKVKRGERFNSK